MLPICFAMGEGVGTAAGLAVKAGCALRDVSVPEVQARLRGYGIAEPTPARIC